MILKRLRVHNQNNEENGRKQFDWFGERRQMRAAFGWFSEQAKQRERIESLKVAILFDVTRSSAF